MKPVEIYIGTTLRGSARGVGKGGAYSGMMPSRMANNMHRMEKPHT